MPNGLLDALINLGGRVGSQVRYGMPLEDKERLALSGQLPGAPEDPAMVEERQRHGAGYLFGQEWPRLSTAVMPAVNLVKGTDWWGLGGSSPELQSWANHGQTLGAMLGLPSPEEEAQQVARNAPGSTLGALIRQLR